MRSISFRTGSCAFHSVAGSPASMTSFQSLPGGRAFAVATKGTFLRNSCGLSFSLSLSSGSRSRPQQQPMKARAGLFISILVAAVAVAQPTGKPQYGTWGFDTEGADLKMKPGDDFFRYAGGAWLDRVQIPADKPGYSLRLAMTDLTEQRLHDLMEENARKAEPKPTTVEGRVGACYKSVMDEARIAKAGAAS